MICSGLKIEQFSVTSIEHHEFVMQATFMYSFPFEHKDAVGESDSAETMANKNPSFAEKDTQACEERCQRVAMFVIMFWPDHVCRENRNQEIEEKVASYALHIYT
jgi:hypothetical protein